MVGAELLFLSFGVEEYSFLFSNILLNFCFGSFSPYLELFRTVVEPFSISDVSSGDMIALSVRFVIEYPPRPCSFFTGNLERGSISPFGSLINISADAETEPSCLSVFSSVEYWFEKEAAPLPFGAKHRSLAFVGETLFFLTMFA